MNDARDERPSEAPPEVSVVVPVRNEAGNLAPLVSEIAAAFGERTRFEIVYVNDGSSDATETELSALMVERPWLRQIRHASSCGQSAAVRTGVAHARAPVVVTLDGDGQNDPAFIPALVAALAAGAPRTSLSPASGSVARPRASELQSRVANGVRGAVLRDRTRDTGCGLKAFPRDLFLSLPYFDGLHRFLPALIRREGLPSAMSTWSTARAGTGGRTTACGTGCGSASLDLFGVWWLIRRKKRVPQVLE
jgi:glycosyltransferase involved in cell wall biosynthesis